MSLCPAAIRASAIRAASTPAASSPMKVRDEPVTPCTIAMLPAKRFESCAKNSVGRRSFISRSLRKPGPELPFASRFRMLQSTLRSRSPPPDATSHGIHVSAQILIGEGDMTEGDRRVGPQLAANADFRFGHRITRAFVKDAGLYRQQFARRHEAAHLGFLDGRQKWHALEFHQGEQ